VHGKLSENVNHKKKNRNVFTTTTVYIAISNILHGSCNFWKTEINTSSVFLLSEFSRTAFQNLQVCHTKKKAWPLQPLNISQIVKTVLSLKYSQRMKYEMNSWWQRNVWTERVTMVIRSNTPNKSLSSDYKYPDYMSNWLP